MWGADMENLKSFAEFASRKPADEHYNFMNCTGGCAIGQWMASTGQKWDMDIYQDLIREMFGERPEEHSVLVQSDNWGALSKGLKERVDA